MTFDPRIPFEMAARLKHPKDILRDYGFVGRDAFTLVASPLFQAELKRCLEELVASGLSFRQRARMLAPDALETAYDLMTDNEVSPAVRADTAKWIAKMADVEPKEKSSGVNDRFVLQINL